MFPTQKSLQEGHTTTASQIALKYTIRKVEENQKQVKMNWRNPVLVFPNDINLLSKSMHAIKENGSFISCQEGGWSRSKAYVPSQNTDQITPSRQQINPLKTGQSSSILE
jgi:hypothetical protein